MMKEKKRIPEDYFECENDVISNFDAIENTEVTNQLKTENCYSPFPAWNFYGKVWFDDGLFYCEVWTYGSYSNTFKGEDIMSLRDNVCDVYGYD